jgi:predicted transcriptional regulator
MEEKQEILAAIKESFTQLDQKMTDGFTRVDQQFATIRKEFAEELGRQSGTNRKEFAEELGHQSGTIRKEFAEELGRQSGTIRKEFTEELGRQSGTIRKEFAEELGRQSGTIRKEFAEELGGQFATLRRQFAEQLDGVNDGLHAETRALKELIIQKHNEALATNEGLEQKLGLLGENLGNIRTQLAQYHHRFEAPLEARVVKLEAHAWAADQQKKDETAAESRRGS